MSAGRVSKLVAPSAGKRTNTTNNNGGVRPSLKQPVVGRNNVIGASGGRSTTSRSPSVTSSTASRLPRSGSDEDYVTVQFVRNGQCAQTAASSSDVGGTVCQRAGAGAGGTSLEQQNVLATHLQVSRSIQNMRLIIIIIITSTISIAP